jgi:hypothetical protein
VLDPTDARASLRRAFLSGSVRDLSSVLAHFGGFFTLEMFRFAPPHLIGAVIDFFMHSSDTTFSLGDALFHLRGPWRSLALAKVSANPSSFVQFVSTAGRLRKSDILSFCSSVDTVGYPRTTVTNLAVILFYEAQHRPRIRAALRLLNVSVAAAGGFSAELATSVLSSIRSRQESVSLMELTYTLRLICDVLHSSAEFSGYLDRLLRDWRDASVVHERLHVVHLGLPTSFCGAAEEAVVANSLRSERASQFLMGLRQFERVAALDSPRALRALSHVLLTRFQRFARISGVVATATGLATVVLLRPTYAPIHDAVFDALAETAAVPPSAAYFCDALAWIPPAVRCGRNADGVVAQANLFMRINSPQAFALAAAVLMELIRAAPPQRKDAVAMEAFLTFLSDHAEKQGLFTAFYLRGFADVFDGLEKNTIFHFCANTVKAVAFLPCLLCVAAVVKRVADQEWTRELVEALVTLVDEPAQQNAFKCLCGGQLTREAIDAAWAA